jgi:hypothetical protein
MNIKIISGPMEEQVESNVNKFLHELIRFQPIEAKDITIQFSTTQRYDAATTYSVMIIYP